MAVLRADLILRIFLIKLKLPVRLVERYSYLRAVKLREVDVDTFKFWANCQELWLDVAELDLVEVLEELMLVKVLDLELLIGP